MNHQTVGRQAIWQDVIGNPLVEDIVLVEVIVVICRIRITLVIYDPCFTSAGVISLAGLPSCSSHHSSGSAKMVKPYLRCSGA